MSQTSIQVDDMSETAIRCFRTAPPKLKKNKRLEQRWGGEYYEAVKKAVFAVQQSPFIPAKPSSALYDGTDNQPLYMCKQCRDRFYFPSSLAAHNSRRSWILGYWCYSCFLITCFHTKKGQPPCFDCQDANRQRTVLLRAKGLRKGRRMGCIKIFYNQCQFFAHLRGHNTTMVDMAHVMLMPIPTDADEESYADIEQLCETIMERMFLTRTHIMDWLRFHQLGDNWWRSIQSRSEKDEDSLAKMLAATRRNRSGTKSVKYSAKPQKTIPVGQVSSGALSPGSSPVTYPSRPNTPSSISATIESVIAQANCIDTVPPPIVKMPEMPPLSLITRIEPQESIENDDNPCTTADIAFVDCGPAAKTYPPDVAIVLPAKDKLTIVPNGNISCSSIVNVRTDSSSRVSGAPLILKQCQANNVVHSTSSGTGLQASHGSFEPKITVKKFANERLKTPLAISCQKNYSKVNTPKPQALRKLAPAPKVGIPSGKKSLPSAMEIEKMVEISKMAAVRPSLSTLGSQMIKVHSSKNAELSKIISQLPPDVISGKKIVFIGQDTEQLTILPKNDRISSSSGMIKIQSETDKSKIIQTLPMKIAPKVVSNVGNERGMKIPSEISKKNSLTDKTKPKMHQAYLDGKVIYQNGKKFIIRHARKPIPESTVCTNINNLKLQTIPKHVSLASLLSKSRFPSTSFIQIAAKSGDTGTNKVVFPVTPSSFNSCSDSPSSCPSPALSPCPSSSEDPMSSKPKAQIKLNGNDPESSEKSAGSTNSIALESTKVTSLFTPPLHKIEAPDAIEYFSIEKNAAGKSCVDFSKVQELSRPQTAVNYKEQIRDRFRLLNPKRIKQQIDHLIEINAEYSRMVGVTDDDRISENLKAIKDLENVLKEKPPRSDQDQDIDQESSDEDINEILSNSKETRVPPSMCSTCNRSITSESHIPEYSKESIKSSSCRTCNNYVCHICDVFQGNLSRFRAHLNFHAKKKPFTCPECFRKFATFRRLETHTWTACFHPLARRWFKCRVCQVEGFLNMESVTKHFMLAHSKLKIACSKCGILSKTRAAFRKHIEEDHPKAANPPQPVNLMVCDIGNCVVRLESYRSHMDHHTAVINMFYYKCSVCSHLIRAVKQGKEQMKSHFYNKHPEKLTELLRLEHAHLDYLKQSSDNNSQGDDNPNIHDDLTSNLSSDKNNQSKHVEESEQNSDVLEIVQTNTGAITLDSVGNDSHADNQSSSEDFDATLSKQKLRDNVECSIWSIDLDQTDSSELTDLGAESLEFRTTGHGDVNKSDNVITEYSSSPKIFDVRSVTPDSYAELDGVAKEQIDVITQDGEKIGDESLPMKFSQVIVINQAETNLNLTEMLQSTFTAPNTFVQLSDLANSCEKTATSRAVELGLDPIHKNEEMSLPVIKTVSTLAHPPGSQQYKKNVTGSTTVTKLLESVDTSKQSVDGKRTMLPVSILKSKNRGIQNIKSDIFKPNNRVSDANSKVVDISQITTNTSANFGENTMGLLLCNIPKPPPLARIPQHILDISRVEDEVGVKEEEPRETNVITSRSLLRLNRKRRQPWRIALNAPICSSELIHYRCHLCGELINTSWSVIRNHFGSRHSQDYQLAIVTPKLLRLSSEFISEGYKEVLGPKKRKSDGSVPSSKRRRRWNPKKRVEKPLLSPGLCVQQESVQDGEGNFICKQCDQRCNDISSLREHIGTNHRIKDHYLVCLECGENFVVEPSLQMHLKAFHRIKDPSAYMTQNTGYAKKITVSAENESNTGIANQCHVCMAVFEDKLAVDKHLRVHGMAFLNRKRIEAQNAARNPEKESKPDKPDDSLAAAAAAAAQKNEKLENNKIGKIGSVKGTVRES